MTPEEFLAGAHAAAAEWGTQNDKGEFMCNLHDGCRATSLHS